MWRRIEVVITSLTRNQVVLRGSWVRIPPSPLFLTVPIKKIKFTLYKEVNLCYYIGIANYYSLWLRVVTLCNTFQRAGGRCKAAVSVGWMDLWGFGWAFMLALNVFRTLQRKGMIVPLGGFISNGEIRLFFILITAWVDIGRHSI